MPTARPSADSASHLSPQRTHTAPLCETHTRGTSLPDVWLASILPRIPLAWHLLSLDAPTIAALWCVYLAHALQIRLPSASPYFLALGTWWIYVADRLLDGRKLTKSSVPADSSQNGSLRERHLFYARHRTPFLIGLISATILLLFAAFTIVPSRLVIRDLCLCSAGAIYFLIIHSTKSHGPLARVRRIFPPKFAPKELAVGIFFSIATVLPLTLGSNSLISLIRRPAILIAAAAFAALCWLNCAAIQHWEDATPDSVRITRAAALLAIVTGAVLITPASLHLPNTLRPIFAAICISSLALFLLSRHSHRFTRQTLRISADAVLLTPLLFLALLS